MSSDLSSSQPGPMGWGTPDLRTQEKLDREQEQRDKLAEIVPSRLMRAAPRTPVTSVLNAIKHEMSADGIDGGFSCRYIEKVVFGKFLLWLMQLIGSCVASGSMRAITRRTLLESFLLGDPEEIFGTKLVTQDNVAPFAPYHYRAGRRLGGLNGNQDGSFCEEQVRSLMQFGMLPCATVGLSGDTDAFPEPRNESTYRKWGASNTIMDKYVSAAKRFQLLESEKITDAEQGKDALVQGFKPFMICSDWAFRPKEKHSTWTFANGEAAWIYERDRSTSWAHNMTIDGFVEVAGQWYVVVDNSWGETAHKNGSFFMIPIEVYSGWLTNGKAECASIGNIDLTDNAAPFPSIPE